MIYDVSFKLSAAFNAETEAARQAIAIDDLIILIKVLDYFCKNFYYN